MTLIAVQWIMLVSKSTIHHLQIILGHNGSAWLDFWDQGRMQSKMAKTAWVDCCQGYRAECFH